MDFSNNSKLEELEQWLRQGNIQAVRKVLADVTPSQVPKSAVTRTAKLFRRAGLELKALRLLGPVVHPVKNEPTSIADDSQWIEYAANLSQVGAFDEANGILSRVSDANATDILSIKTDIALQQWNYQKAIPLLKEYLSHDIPSLEDRTQARAMLLASLMATGEYEQAETLREELLTLSTNPKARPMLGRVYESCVSGAVARRNFAEARRYLDQVKSLSCSAVQLDSLFVPKWQAIVSLLENPVESLENHPLFGVRKQAATKRLWETVRSCDYYAALARHDSSLFMRVYFGTPHEAFRKRMLSRWEQPLDLPESYIWTLDGASARRVIDVASFSGRHVPPSRLLRRLLQVLSLDFYHPQRLASVHAALYPGEQFNPASSPARVHRAVSRLRQWLNQQKLPHRVTSGGGGFLFDVGNSGGVSVSPQIKTQIERDTPEQRMLDLYQTKTFTARDVAKNLHMSARTAQYFIRDGVAAGWIRRFGKGRATVYELTTQMKKSA